MTEVTEHELHTLFQERADAVSVQSLPPMPPMAIDSGSNQRGRFWLAIAAAVLLLAGAGWMLVDSTRQPTEVDAADGTDSSTETDSPTPVGERVNLSEAANVVPTSAEDTDRWLRHWATDGPIIVVTGAEWCPPCQTDIPKLLPMLDQLVWDNRLVAVVGIGDANDSIWIDSGWSHPVLELRGDRDQAHSLLPVGLDFYPAVAVWTTDGIAGPASAIDGLTTEELQRRVATVPLD